MGHINVPKLGAKIPSIDPVKMPDSWKYFTSLKQADGDQAFLFCKGGLDWAQFVAVPADYEIYLYGGSDGITPLYKYYKYKWYRYENGDWVLSKDNASYYASTYDADPVNYPAPSGLFFSELTGKLVYDSSNKNQIELFTIITHNTASPNIAALQLTNPSGINATYKPFPLLAYSGYQAGIAMGTSNINCLEFVEIVGTTNNTLSDVFSGRSALKSFKVPDNISNSFSLAYDMDLIEFKIPSSMTSLPNNMFNECHSIQKVEIHNNITALPNSCFNNCYSLRKVENTDELTTLGSNAFTSCSALENVNIPKVTSIGADAFRGCRILKEIELNNNITQIPANCFDGCSSLRKVNIPTSTTQILDMAFYYDYSLMNVEFPNGLVSIGNNAFERCYSLTSVKLPNTLTTLGNSAFSACRPLKEVVLSNSLTSIPNYCFSQCNTLSKIELPDTITSIGTFGFYNCNTLKKIEIPENVTVIGSSAFAYSLELRYMKLRGAPPTLGNVNAFQYCYDKMKILIPYQYIGNYRSATNWMSTTNGIFQRQRGYKTFTEGETLPTVDSSGIWALTWYDGLNDILATAYADDPTTTPITVAPHDGEFYCTFSVAP